MDIHKQVDASDDNEPTRVRRVKDGRFAVPRIGGSLSDIAICWWQVPPEDEGVWPRRQAAVIANAIIAITGDHGISIEPAASVSISGDEPEYAPGDCSAFKVRDLAGRVPERLFKTREAAEAWVRLVTEGNPAARLIIEQNAGAVPRRSYTQENA